EVEQARRKAVRAETVERPAIAVLPQRARQPQGRANDQEVVNLVEIPLVEQELVERLLLARELDRQLGPADVELPGDDEADSHRQGWNHSNKARDLVHRFEDMAARGEFDRVAEELTDIVADEQLAEGIAGENRAGGQEAEGNEHHHRALARRVVVMLIVRSAVERQEDEPPRI